MRERNTTHLLFKISLEFCVLIANFSVFTYKQFCYALLRGLSHHHRTFFRILVVSSMILAVVATDDRTTPFFRNFIGFKFLPQVTLDTSFAIYRISILNVTSHESDATN